MPQITPAANDVVQIKIRGAGGFSQEQFITAEIVSLTPVQIEKRAGATDSKFNLWQIQVPGDPELTGTIDIDKYQWDHKQTRWLPKEGPVQPAKTNSRIVADPELEVPSRIIADSELDIPRHDTRHEPRTAG